MYQRIDNTCAAEQLHYNTGDNHHREEMGGVGDQLNRLFHFAGSTFVDCDCQNNRREEAGDQTIQADANCIVHQPPELGGTEQVIEML